MKESAALSGAAPTGLRLLRLPLSRYVGHRHRGRVEQASQNRVELGLRDFGNFGHETIVDPRVKGLRFVMTP